MTDVALDVLLERGRWGLALTARLVLFAGILSLVALLVLMATGFRTLVVRSGSMAPAIETGDVIVTKLVAPTEAAVGDVVTFRDPSRSSELVTHRVRKVETRRGKVSFVTRGDSNTGVERWSIETTGEIGKVVFRIPSAGYPAAWLGTPALRAALLAGAALLLAGGLLRAVWLR